MSGNTVFRSSTSETNNPSEVKLTLTFFLFLSFSMTVLGQAQQPGVRIMENDTFKVCRWEGFDLIQALSKNGLERQTEFAIIDADVDTRIEGFQLVKVATTDTGGFTDTLNLTVHVHGCCLQSVDHKENILSLNYSSESVLLEVSFLSEAEDSCQLMVLDHLGREVIGLTRVVSTEDDMIFNVKHLAVGTYYLQARYNGFSELEKFDIVH